MVRAGRAATCKLNGLSPNTFGEKLLGRTGIAQDVEGRGYCSSPAVIAPGAYERAYMEARQAGAAGWVFHTAAGFSLDKRPFIDALAPNERAGLSRLVGKDR